MGKRIWIKNFEKYCGKILQFNPQAQFSLHYHVLKEETWYISKGNFLLTFVDTNSADFKQTEVKEGEIIHLAPGVPHQLKCLSQNGGEIFEVSTEHFDSDSYRILAGDSQK